MNGNSEDLRRISADWFQTHLPAEERCLGSWSLRRAFCLYSGGVQQTPPSFSCRSLFRCRRSYLVPSRQIMMASILWPVISALGDYLSFRNNSFNGPAETGPRPISVAGRSTMRWLPAFSSTCLRRFTFKTVPFDHEKLAKPSTGLSHLFGNFDQDLPGLLNTLPKDAVDAYIIVRPFLAYQAPGIEGLGLKMGPPLATQPCSLDRF